MRAAAAASSIADRERCFTRSTIGLLLCASINRQQQERLPSPQHPGGVAVFFWRAHQAEYRARTQSGTPHKQEYFACEELLGPFCVRCLCPRNSIFGPYAANLGVNITATNSSNVESGVGPIPFLAAQQPPVEVQARVLSTPTTAMRAVGTKRPRGHVATADQASLAWAGRVPKPAMDADSFVDYGSGFLRKSCDSCVSSKRRCDGQDPCTRCLRRKKPCHYTERKKCGPRSGQKTTNSGVGGCGGTPSRRPRGAASPDPTAAAAAAAAASPSNRHDSSSSQQHHHHHPQHQQRGNSVHRMDSTKREPSSSSSSSCSSNSDGPAVGGGGYSGLRLGPPPPQHAAPSLSSSELSGETTCVDHTDSSDGPPPSQTLLRDESGSSWWSLEDGASVPSGSTSSRMPPARSRAGGGWGEVRQQQHRQEEGEGRRHEDRSCASGYSVDERRLQQQHQPQQRHGGREGGGVHWGGGMSSGRGGGAGGAGGSGGSGSGESTEDDASDGQDQEEGFGQAEEEVAALLVRLGKTDTYFQGFSDDDHDHDDEVGEARLSVDRGSGVNVSRQREVQHVPPRWAVVAGGGGGGIHERGGGRYS